MSPGHLEYKSERKHSSGNSLSHLGSSGGGGGVCVEGWGWGGGQEEQILKL